MQIFLDTADVAQIERWKGVIRGVTTNPSILKKCFRGGGTSFAGSGGNCAGAIENVLRVSSPLPVSIEVATDDQNCIFKQAVTLSELGENVVVKVPIVTREGKSCLPVIARLTSIGRILGDTKEPVKVNVTACMTAAQVFLAAQTNPTYISLFAGRMQDEGLEPFGEKGVISKCWELLGDAMPNHGISLIVGSVRTMRDATLAIESMADIVTITPEILEKLCDNSASRKVVTQFLEDAK